MKVVEIELTYRTLVSAETREEAIRDAEYNLNESDEEAESISAQEVTDLANLPSEWDEDCIPWGGGEKTLKEILLIFI